ncbi:hypothetical protein P5618_029440 (plasmid) [Priestia megaterium]|uniref:hypothetical protein n=1 Tax=Priestia megaterium TaxID=1404 RepID=UPI0024533852|nr:hypothetical protein [Priestia megaterium]MDH3177882.1 hypothetical protein [Priestia megaterium]
MTKNINKVEADKQLAEIINDFINDYFDDNATIKGVKWRKPKPVNKDDVLSFILGISGYNWEFEMVVNNNKNPIIYPTINYDDEYFEYVKEALNKDKRAIELRDFFKENNILRFPMLLDTDYESEGYSDLKNKM